VSPAAKALQPRSLLLAHPLAAREQLGARGGTALEQVRGERPEQRCRHRTPISAVSTARTLPDRATSGR